LLANSKGFLALLDELRADVIHVHGLGFSREVVALRAHLPRTPILLQDHADRIPRLWRRGAWRHGVAAANGIAFCAQSQSQPFRKAGLLAPHLRVFEIPESTSRFTPGDRAVARAASGLTGEPGVLWVGHLDANKDPLTVLEGVSAAVEELPDLELWCCFGNAPLRGEVDARIAADPRLRQRVHLIGRVPHARIETLMRAADLFVAGSHREGSGYSLIEAMSCGLPAAVTDIPSFRALSGGGAIGALWQTGDARGCRDALLALAAQPRATARAAVRAHFDAHVSTAAVGRRFAAAYAELAR
jgi:glycosyltransferase involved in cell wall biosynthesis